MTSSSSASMSPRGFRFGLRSVLVAVFVVGIVLAWWVDRSRLREEVRRAQLQNEIYERQFVVLQRRLKEAHSRGFWQTARPPGPTADAILEHLKSDIDDDLFLQVAPRLSDADDTEAAAAIPRMLVLLEDERPDTRRRAVILLRFFQQESPERMQPHAEQVVAALIPLIEDDNTSVKGETILTFRYFGATAAPAVSALRRHMDDDESSYAPLAARSIHRIDPSVDIGPRLIELVERKHRNWYSAACELPKHVEPERARAVLTRLYDSMEKESDRKAVIEAMTQIKPREKS
jgi:HEAT repeat protein